MGGRTGNAMQLMLTGDTMSGKQAVEYGWANGSVPEAELEAHVLDMAQASSVAAWLRRRRADDPIILTDADAHDGRRP